GRAWLAGVAAPSGRARAGGERGRGARVVGVDVPLERVRVADDEQRVAERLELGFEPRRIEVALDDERRAVAVARELLVDGVDRHLRRLRRSGHLLTGGDCGEAPRELDQPGTARVD